MNLASRIAAGAGALALAATLSLSPNGATEIKKDEGLRTVAYLDSVQVPTVCYGSTAQVYLGMKQTQAQCDARFIRDVQSAQNDVKRYVKHELTQYQYDALVSFVYNLGGTKFKGSTLLKRINSGDCLGAYREFPRWVYAGKTKLRGLVLRRQKEANYWLTGCSAWN